MLQNHTKYAPIPDGSLSKIHLHQGQNNFFILNRRVFGSHSKFLRLYSLWHHIARGHDAHSSHFLELWAIDCQMFTRWIFEANSDRILKGHNLLKSKFIKRVFTIFEVILGNDSGDTIMLRFFKSIVIKHNGNKLLFSHPHFIRRDSGELISAEGYWLSFSISVSASSPLWSSSKAISWTFFPGRLDVWWFVLLDIWWLILTSFLVHKNIRVAFTLEMVVFTIEALFLLGKVLEDLSIFDWRMSFRRPSSTHLLRTKVAAFLMRILKSKFVNLSKPGWDISCAALVSIIELTLIGKPRMRSRHCWYSINPILTNLFMYSLDMLSDVKAIQICQEHGIWYLLFQNLTCKLKNVVQSTETASWEDTILWKISTCRVLNMLVKN